MFSYTLLIILLPLISFLILGIAGKWFSHKTAGIIGTLSLAAVTVLSYYAAYEYFIVIGRDAVTGAFERQIPLDFTWLPFFDQGLCFNMGILLDPISVMMLIVISTVSLMVHIYSFGYMKGERGFQRYYAFLSLFTMSMLGLVVATNIFQMYLFWELVGVSSYLLIGFYYTSPAAIAASKKAFIVTRFADLFFLIGILIYGYYTNSFGFVFDTEAGLQSYAQAGAMLPIALTLMFVGGAGKSAMFPLHIWLPDAMEGPTPVSALIHAATMVVAGVFQIARLFPLWVTYAQDWMPVIIWVGVFTAFYAAAVACAQSDIKRVLAFSTISQIAFMMVALGVCTEMEGHGAVGYMASLFHLFTHAMFKACLFLGAGCIIHAVHSNEMEAMGGLRKYLPITHITFLISCLAISGIPFFSGFSSKDEIITACMHYSPVVGYIMTAIAAMTAFYMFRLYYGIFWGTENKELHAAHHPHETKIMTLPLVVLSLITVGVGIYTTLAGFGIIDGANFGEIVSADNKGYHIHFDYSVAITSTVVAIISIALATYIFKGEQQPIADKMYAAAPRLHRWAYKRFYMDEVWQFVTHRIIFAYVSRPIAWFDRHVIDGFFNFLAWGTNALSNAIKGMQSGRVQQYAWIYLVGTIILIAILLIF